MRRHWSPGKSLVTRKVSRCGDAFRFSPINTGTGMARHPIMTMIFVVNFPIFRSRKALIIFPAFDGCISDQNQADQSREGGRHNSEPRRIAAGYRRHAPPYEFGVKVSALDAAKAHMIGEAATASAIPALTNSP